MELRSFDQIDSGALDVVHPSGQRTRIVIEPVPFRIGRSPDNHLILRDNRASRIHAQIYLDQAVKGKRSYSIEDLDSLHGTWVNGARIQRPKPLSSGDSVHFGFEDSYRLVFSNASGRISRILGELSAGTPANGAVGSLARLRALIEVARTLQTSPATEDVLSAVVDAAISLTGCERGFLLLRCDDALELRVGRDARGSVLAKTDLHVPSEVISRALNERRELLFMSLNPSELQGVDASVINTEFSHVTCVPLIQFRSISSQQTITVSSGSDTVGVLYLDSRRQQGPLSELNRELLHTLALEASTVLENAELLEEERQKHQMEQELAVAREIQQSLLPRTLPASGWFCAAGSSLPLAEVGGDYFDVRPIDEDTWAAVVADVSGKGVSSALLASLLQGAFLLASELKLAHEEVMGRINNFLIDRAQGEKYATLFYATIHRSGQVAWSNAGHIPPLLVRLSGEVAELGTTGMPLGLMPHATFEVQRLQLSAGDKIVAYSDGVTESENRNQEKFESRLKPTLKAAAGLNAQQVHDRLLEEVRSFHHGEPLQDDVTILVLEYGKNGVRSDLRASGTLHSIR